MPKAAATDKQDTAKLSFRSFAIEDRTIDEKSGAIAVSLSSETPVPRWDGLEILDHSPSAVDMSRAKRGLALLLDHSTRQQVGRIEDLKLDGGKLRGVLRFSKSAAAQEVRQDVVDGIRQEV